MCERGREREREHEYMNIVTSLGPYCVSICVMRTFKEEYLVIILGYCFLFLNKSYVVGTHQKALGEMFLMSTHNICFYADIEKIIQAYHPKYSSISPVILWKQMLSL